MFRGLVTANDWHLTEHRRELMAAADHERRIIAAETGGKAKRTRPAPASRASTLAMAALLGATMTIVGQVIADPVAGLLGAAADGLVTTLMDGIGPDEAPARNWTVGELEVARRKHWIVDDPEVARRYRPGGVGEPEIARAPTRDGRELRRVRGI